MTAPPRDPASRSLTATERIDIDYWIYRWFDADDVLLYVGVTMAPGQRERNHRRAWWAAWAHRCDWEGPLRGRRAAFARESAIVSLEHPVFNRSRNPATEAEMRRYIRAHGDDPDAFAAHYPKRTTDQAAAIGRTITLPAELWEVVDRAATAAAVDRSQWLAELIALHRSTTPGGRCSGTVENPKSSPNTHSTPPASSSSSHRNSPA